MKPFEVYCPRCDVTFPVGTKRCVHCGGRTVSSGQPRMPGTIRTGGYSEGSGTGASEAPQPIEWQPDPGLQLPEYDAEGRELEMDDESPTIARSLIRSLGGLIWVIALVAFSLARNCSDK